MDEFDELDLDTGNRLIVLVYDSQTEGLKIENPHKLPYALVLGLLHQSIDEWEIEHSEWAFVADEEDE